MAKVLVIDDDPHIIKLVELVLVQLGHDVTCAKDAIVAMETLDKTDFDALICDANMPHFSGFDLLNTLKNQKKHLGMATIMLSARKEKKDIKRALDLGVDDYIVKPLDPQLLQLKLDAVLSKKPPLQRLDLDWGSANINRSVEIVTEATVAFVSELGMVIKSSTQLQEGSSLKLAGGVFIEIGAPPPLLRVKSCLRLEDGLWQIKTQYIGPSNEFLEKVREFILTKRAKGNAAA